MQDGANIRDQHREGFSELNKFWDELDALEASVDAYADEAPPFVEEQLERIHERIVAFEPTVSVIGQIKAGKSTLLNALIGETQLLPSDVNPWTSVITGIHLNSRMRPPNTRALFRFFDAEEWDRLVETGGRLGEIAMRAGFESEVDEVREQVVGMRQSTEERLGDEFGELLGRSRAFPDINKDLLDRYICYGDPDDLAEGSTEGVYADLTKSADLYMDLPDLPKGLCFRDTPGVNDTFMMREQITLNAISESRVCVVVLSAHQALSTMDLALMRIICSVEAREVLIFVNRIDELDDPEAEKKNIGKSIRMTLGRLGLGADIDILFGSGYWANCALEDRCENMMPSSRAALEKLYGAEFDLSNMDVLRDRAMEASGVKELHRAIAKRVVEGPGRAILTDLTAEFGKAQEMRETVVSLSDSGTGQRDEKAVAEVQAKLIGVEQKTLEKFDAKTAKLRQTLRDRLERAQMTFVESAVEALQSHIDAFGEMDNWSHEPSSLRMMMRSAYSSVTTKLRREGEVALEEIADEIQDILRYDLQIYQDAVTTEFPTQPQQKPPTALAKTLSLDLQPSWWRKFWRFGGRNRADKRYRALIEAELGPLIDELLASYFDEAVGNTRTIVSDFLNDQVAFIKAIIDCAPEGSGEGGVKPKSVSSAA